MFQYKQKSVCMLHNYLHLASNVPLSLSFGNSTNTLKFLYRSPKVSRGPYRRKRAMHSYTGRRGV